MPLRTRLIGGTVVGAGAVALSMYSMTKKVTNTATKVLVEAPINAALDIVAPRVGNDARASPNPPPPQTRIRRMPKNERCDNDDVYTSESQRPLSASSSTSHIPPSSLAAIALEIGPPLPSLDAPDPGYARAHEYSFTRLDDEYGHEDGTRDIVRDTPRDSGGGGGRGVMETSASTLARMDHDNNALANLDPFTNAPAH
jgi:hypothetical protein